MKISKETMERITRPIGGDFDVRCQDGKRLLEDMHPGGIDAHGVSSKEIDATSRFPRNLHDDHVDGIQPRAQRATLRAVLQFNFSGEVEGSCHFKIENGKIEAREGASEKPDLTLNHLSKSGWTS